MGKNIEQRAEDFVKAHENVTGDDAGQKIAEDLANAVKGMTETQKREFYQSLDHQTDVYDKVDYDFKDNDKDGIRDTLTARTEYDAHPWIPGYQKATEETNLTQEMKNYKPKTESMKRPAQGSALEATVDHVDKTKDAIDQKFDN